MYVHISMSTRWILVQYSLGETSDVRHVLGQITEGMKRSKRVLHTFGTNIFYPMLMEFGQ